MSAKQDDLRPILDTSISHDLQGNLRINQIRTKEKIPNHLLIITTVEKWR
jgi:hypothetical protein